MVNFNEFQKLMDDISEWPNVAIADEFIALATAHKLKKRVNKLIKALNKTEALANSGSMAGRVELVKQIDKTKMEYTYCFMLLLGSAQYFRLSAKDLLYFVRKELEKNKPEPGDNPMLIIFNENDD